MPDDVGKYSVTPDPRRVRFVHDAAQQVPSAVHLAGQVSPNAFGPVGHKLATAIAGLETSLQHACDLLGKSLDELGNDGRQAQLAYHESDLAVADNLTGRWG